jgi:hypothetical protein
MYTASGWVLLNQKKSLYCLSTTETQAFWKTQSELPSKIQASHAYNILILGVESWRADGASPTTMPFVSEFFRSFAPSENHYSIGSRSPTGLFGILSGQNPLYWYPSYSKGVPPAALRAFQRMGYRLTFSSADSVLFYRSLNHYVFGLKELATRYHSIEQYEGIPSENDARVVDQVLRDFDQPEDRPRFDFVFLTATHYPYQFPANYEFHRPAKPIDQMDLTAISVGDKEGIVNRYKNSLRYVDDQIKRIVERLQAKNLLEKTIIVLTGDHGEEFFDEGRFGHSSSLGNPQTKVPLFFRLPNQRKIPRLPLSGHADLMPTLFDAVGAKPSLDSFFSGRSLLSKGSRQLVVSGIGGESMCPGYFRARIPEGHMHFSLDDRGVHPHADQSDISGEKNKALNSSLRKRIKKDQFYFSGEK